MTMWSEYALYSILSVPIVGIEWGLAIALTVETVSEGIKMIIETSKKGTYLRRISESKLNVLVQVGSHVGYMDVLHFYFPQNCKVKVEAGHIVILLSEIEFHKWDEAKVVDPLENKKTYLGQIGTVKQIERGDILTLVTVSFPNGDEVPFLPEELLLV